MGQMFDCEVILSQMTRTGAGSLRHPLQVDGEQVIQIEINDAIMSNI